MEHSNINTPGEPAFWRVCNNDGVCHCNFRLTIHNCAELDILRLIYLINIIWTGVSLICAIICIFYRIRYKGQSIFDCSGKFPHPKPVESLLTFGALYLLFHLINSLILYFDIGKHGMIRDIIYQFPWCLLITAYNCYAFGVVYTLAASDKILFKSWAKSLKIVNVLIALAIGLPYITVIPLSLVTGYYAQIGDVIKANNYSMAVKYLFTVYSFALGLMEILAGLRLIYILKHHLQLSRSTEEGDERVKRSIFNVRMIVTMGCFTAWLYTASSLLYIVARRQVVGSKSGLIFSTVWVLFLGPVCLNIIQIAILIKRKKSRSFHRIALTSSDSSTNDTIGSTSITFVDSQNQRRSSWFSSLNKTFSEKNNLQQV
ncbi:unnamed protein product [Cunninghamella echinulata]